MTTDTFAPMDQLVTFRLGREEFGLSINSVQEIVRPPAVTRVPFAPPFIEGIANLRGDILPLVNLRDRFGMPDKAADTNTRVVVLKNGNHALGLIVDGVSEVTQIDEHHLDRTQNGRSFIDSRFIRGIANLNDGKRIILILNEDEIIPKAQSAANDSRKVIGKDNSEMQQADQQVRREGEEHLVSFWLNQQEFALQIQAIKEIIRVREITALPDAPPFIMGVISLRNSLIPIIDLHQRLGRFQEAFGTSRMGSVPESATQEKRIVVVDMQGFTVGLLVERVSEVLRIPKKHIAPPPAILGSQDRNFIRGIGKVEDGKRMVILLDETVLLPSHDLEQLKNAMKEETQGDPAMEQEANASREIQLVCFYIADEEYAIDIMNVQEIVRIQQITKIPNAPHYIEGIINLRGNILPVIDVRARFGLPPKPRSEQNRIVVVNDGKTTKGLIVDSVSEVLRTYTDNISDPPETVRLREEGYFKGVVSLDDGKRVILLIDINTLLRERAVPSTDPEAEESAPVEG